MLKESIINVDLFYFIKKKKLINKFRMIFKSVCKDVNFRSIIKNSCYFEIK